MSRLSLEGSTSETSEDVSGGLITEHLLFGLTLGNYERLTLREFFSTYEHSDGAAEERVEDALLQFLDEETPVAYVRGLSAQIGEDFDGIQAEIDGGAGGRHTEILRDEYGNYEEGGADFTYKVRERLGKVRPLLRSVEDAQDALFAAVSAL